MDSCWRPIWRAATATLLLLVLCLAPSTVAAQADWDPAGAVAAYSAALNAHDVASALALFDEYGSAADESGRHFAGRAALTEFLLDSGFGDPAASITTKSLIVVANRALWTYTCSCAAGSTDVRMVLIHNKISVFAIMAPPAAPLRSADHGVLPWLMGIGLGVGILAGGLRLRRRYSAAPVPRASQGRLIAALVQTRATRLTRSAVQSGTASNCPRQP